MTFWVCQNFKRPAHQKQLLSAPEIHRRFFNRLLFSHCCNIMWISNYMYISVKPWSLEWLIAVGAYPGFCSMKRLGVFLLPLDGMLVHQRSPPCNLLGFSNKVSCLRTQHNVPGQGSNPDHSIRGQAH